MQIEDFGSETKDMSALDNSINVNQYWLTQK